SALVARGRRLRPRRPPGMRGDNWRALRRGLSWSREQRNMTMEKWLEQLGVSDGVETLPPLARLTGAPPPSVWPQRLATAAIVLCSLGLAALAIDRLAGTQLDHALTGGLSNAWDSIRQQIDAVTTPVPPTASEPIDADSGPGHAAISPALALRPNPSAPANPAPAAITASASPSAHAKAARSTHGAGAMLASTAAAPSGERDTALASSSPGPAPASTVTAAADPPHAEFDAPSYAVLSSDPAARITLRRVGGSNNDSDLSFSWWTEPATAEPDVDYAAMGRRTDTIPAGSDKITVYVPIISNPLRQHMSQFYVAIGAPQQHSGGPARERVPVTIDRGD
ncbi:MAG: hypothetical protein ACRESY_08895, partial [Steroidobacteraceae bacterium]